MISSQPRGWRGEDRDQEKSSASGREVSSDVKDQDLAAHALGGKKERARIEKEAAYRRVSRKK